MWSPNAGQDALPGHDTPHRATEAASALCVPGADPTSCGLVAQYRAEINAQ
jgi:hypothetical protein